MTYSDDDARAYWSKPRHLGVHQGDVLHPPELVKVRINFREFMEVRHAPALLCQLTDLRVVLIAVALIACYMVGRG